MSRSNNGARKDQLIPSLSTAPVPTGPTTPSSLLSSTRHDPIIVIDSSDDEDVPPTLNSVEQSKQNKENAPQSLPVPPKKEKKENKNLNKTLTPVVSTDGNNGNKTHVNGDKNFNTTKNTAPNIKQGLPTINITQALQPTTTTPTKTPCTAINCRACNIILKSPTSPSLYAVHVHPVLSICVCAPCAISANAIESDLVNHEYSDNSDFCTLCGDGDEEDNDVTLFMCDLCPRSFCESCVGRVCGPDGVAALRGSDDKWGCFVCASHPVLKQWQQECTGCIIRAGDENRDSGDGGQQQQKPLEELVEELNALEDAIDDAQHHLEETHLCQQRLLFEGELDSESDVEREYASYKKVWEDHHTRLQEALPPLQESLELGGISLLAFYESRKENKGESEGEDEDEIPTYRRAAEREMDERDKEEGFSKGSFRGASGYANSHSEIYNLDPEDLPTDMLQVEDINTAEGAIEQMRIVALAPPSSTRSEWGSQELRSIKGSQNNTELLKKQFNKALLHDNFDLESSHAIVSNQIKTIDESEDLEKEREELEKGKGAVLWADQKQCRQRRKRRREEGIRRQKCSQIHAADTAEAVARLKNKRIGENLDEVRLKKRVTPTLITPVDRTPPPRQVWVDSGYRESDIILNMKEETPVSVVKKMATVLKPHQIEGIKFMWDNLVISLKDIRQNPPAKVASINIETENECRGCILAHNMGLGKSLQVIALVHTLFTHPALTPVTDLPVSASRKRMYYDEANRASKRLFFNVVFCVPVNTLANWENEFKIWMRDGKEEGVPQFPVHSVHGMLGGRREGTVEAWYYGGGVLLASFEIFRLLCKNPAVEKLITTADIIVVDEAHQAMGSVKSGIYKALSSTKTPRRIALTGTPLQNNLKEYYRMANWARPSILGSEYQFEREFEVPIMNGMASDSCELSVQNQIRKSRELHSRLSPFVQRRDNTVLVETLPFMQQAVIYVRQSKVQAKLYRQFSKFSKKWGLSFLDCYSKLRPLYNHPACLLQVRETSSAPNQPLNPNISSEGGEIDALNTALDGSASAATGNNEPWWKAVHQKNPNMPAWTNGGKIVVLLEILAQADLVGDKVVVFTQCLKTLDFIETVLQTPHWEKYVPSLGTLRADKNSYGPYRRNLEYLRIDGGTTAAERGELITSFNEKCIENSKVFLLSTKAGGVGINLIAANRVVIFDTHWNPAKDLQALYRCYRYGQTKPVYAYRLLAEGTMEEKIYSRQVNKAGLAARVIDMRFPERFFSQNELSNLMTNDTWVQCDKCEKWRMLPPEADECVENLPDKWYCYMNTFDPARSTCDAEEKDNKWYLDYFRKRGERIRLSMGAAAAERQPADGAAPEEEKKEDKGKAMFTERDDILRRLLTIPVSRKASKQAAAEMSTNGSKDRASSSSGKRIKSAWISKYHFHDTLLGEDDPLGAQQTEKQKEKTPDKSSKKQKSTPDKKSPENKTATPGRKSPRNKHRQKTPDDMKTTGTSGRKSPRLDNQKKLDRDESTPSQSEKEKDKDNKLKWKELVPLFKRAKNVVKDMKEKQNNSSNNRSASHRMVARRRADENAEQHDGNNFKKDDDDNSTSSKRSRNSNKDHKENRKSFSPSLRNSRRQSAVNDDNSDDDFRKPKGLEVKKLGTRKSPRRRARKGFLRRNIDDDGGSNDGKSVTKKRRSDSEVIDILSSDDGENQ